MNNKSRDEWLRDLTDRQRNTVFPDTAQNEARLWRNLLEGKQNLSVVQVLSLVLITLTLLVIAAIDFYMSPDRLSTALTWVFGFAVIGGILLLIKWGTRKR